MREGHKIEVLESVPQGVLFIDTKDKGYFQTGHMFQALDLPKACYVLKSFLGRLGVPVQDVDPIRLAQSLIDAVGLIVVVKSTREAGPTVYKARTVDGDLAKEDVLDLIHQGQISYSTSIEVWKGGQHIDTKIASLLFPSYFDKESPDDLASPPDPGLSASISEPESQASYSVYSLVSPPRLRSDAVGYIANYFDPSPTDSVGFGRRLGEKPLTTGTFERFFVRRSLR